MDFDTPKVTCPVCNGKGGFRRLKQDFLDSNWTDCAYCEGYGFVEDTSTEEEVTSHLLYNRYKTKLILELQKLGQVILCTSEHEGKDMFVQFLPFNREATDRKKWTTLVKHILKFAKHNEKVSVTPKHVFHITDDDEIFVDWELYITTHELKDMEGLIEVIKFYNETIAGGK
jgi:hypothetical protein